MRESAWVRSPKHYVARDRTRPRGRIRLQARVPRARRPIASPHRRRLRNRTRTESRFPTKRAFPRRHAFSSPMGRARLRKQLGTSRCDSAANWQRVERVASASSAPSEPKARRRSRAISHSRSPRSRAGVLVALVDLDLRAPSVATALGISSSRGIDEVLRGRLFARRRARRDREACARRLSRSASRSERARAPGEPGVRAAAARTRAALRDHRLRYAADAPGSRRFRDRREGRRGRGGVARRANAAQGVRARCSICFRPGS